MTTFDGSTTAGSPAVDSAPPPGNVPDVNSTDLGVDALEQLRERVAAANEVREVWVHEIKRTGVRLTCDTNIDGTDYQRWLNGALPKQTRRGRGAAPDVTKMRRELLSARAIIDSCVQVDMLGSDNKYHPILDPQTREYVALDDSSLLTRFGVPDPIELLRKFFVRDADLMNAGEELLTVAGFMGGDDESDPT